MKREAQSFTDDEHHLTNLRTNVISMRLITNSEDHKCPKCEEILLNGPFLRYKKRESELYFDLEKKYFKCTRCGLESEIVDIQVIIDNLSSKLPPEYARKFFMKNMRLYSSLPERMKALLLIMIDEFQQQVLIPRDFYQDRLFSSV